MTDPQPDLRTQLIAAVKHIETTVYWALPPDVVGISSHQAARAYARNAARLLRAAAAALAVPSPQLKKEEEALTRRDSLPLTETPQPAPSGWMPIETAPKDGTRVLIFAQFRGGPQQAVAWFGPDEQYGHVWIAGFRTVYVREVVTHWQPLPSPPQETV